MYLVVAPGELHPLSFAVRVGNDPAWFTPRLRSIVSEIDASAVIENSVALNDVPDTTALVGAVVDVEDQSTALFVEAERRLGDSWKLELESRLFLGVSDSNPLNAIEDDDFVLLRLSYFF